MNYTKSVLWLSAAFTAAVIWFFTSWPGVFIPIGFVIAKQVTNLKGYVIVVAIMIATASISIDLHFLDDRGVKLSEETAAMLTHLFFACMALVAGIVTGCISNTQMRRAARAALQ